MTKIKASQIKLHPSTLEDDGTGQIRQVPGTDGTGGGGEEDRVETITLSNTNITNKYFDLIDEPVDPNNVRLYVIGGTAQQKGVDFDVIVNSPGSLLKRISFNTPLSLYSLLAVNDVVQVVYNVLTTPGGGSLYATNIVTDTTNFNGILGLADSDIQEALETLDDHVHDASTVEINATYNGTLQALINPTDLETALAEIDNFEAANLAIDNSGFTHNLSTSETTIQDALDIVDTLASNQIRVIQGGHAFDVLTPIRFNGTIWVKAKGDLLSTSTNVYLVKEVISSGEFIATSGGRIRKTGHGLASGTWYLSSTTLGTSINVKPSGTFDAPLGFSLPLFAVESPNTVLALGHKHPIPDSLIASASAPSGNTVTFSNIDSTLYDHNLKLEILAVACIGAVSLQINGTSYTWRGTQTRPDTGVDGEAVRFWHHNPSTATFTIAQGDGIAGVNFWDTFVTADLSILNQRLRVSSKGVVGYDTSSGFSETNLLSIPTISAINTLQVSYEQSAGGGTIYCRLLRG